MSGVFLKKFVDLAFLKDLFNFKNSSRSDKAKKNITILFFLHILNFFSLMAIVPVSINYLGKTEYGIWLTLASILSWFINLDFGLGNGLRNKLAESYAVNDYRLARIYVSTAYIVFAIAIIVAILIYISIHNLLNWANILKASLDQLEILNSIVLWVIILFLIQFLLKLLSSIINAAQRPALNGALSLIVNSSTLAAVYLLSICAKSSLFIFSLVNSLIPVLVFLLASIILFKSAYKNVSPSFKYLDFKYSSALVKLGIKFFIVQIFAIVIFSTDSVIISQLYGPDQVTTYNIAYKYFYMVPLVFNVVLAPYWSAFTDAFVKKEFGWIKSTVNKLIFIWGILTFVTIIMIIFSNIAYYLWVGKTTNVPISLSISTGIFVIIANWNNVFAYFLNGIGKIKFQLYYSVVAGIINIPLAIFLAKYLNCGITGVITATNICLIFASFIMPYQYSLLVNSKAKGFWNE